MATVSQDALAKKTPRNVVCATCRKAAGLQVCSGCKTVKYCGDACAREDWPVHKQVCASLREQRVNRKKLLDSARSRRGGGEKEGLKRARRVMRNWYDNVRGLGAEVGLLAWKHRSESPVMFVSTPSTRDDVDGSSPSTGVCVIPRDFVDLRQVMEAADFCPDEHYMIVINDESWSDEAYYSSLFFEKSSQGAVRSIEIVVSVTSSATTTQDDLVAAIAWLRERMSSVSKPIPRSITDVIDYVDHQADVYGPSRALGNQIAYLMFINLSLKFRVTLVDLSGANATHLNGQTGEVRCEATDDLSRFVVRLDGGREVSVKAKNVEHIRGENYRRIHAQGE